MNKAFTLIEILVAVSIMFVVAAGLLSVNSNNTKLIFYANDKNIANLEFSLLLLNDFCEDGDKNLYDAVKTRFNIKDDELISDLKKRSFECESQEVFSMDLSDNTELDETLDDIPQIGFTIDKIAANINGTNTLGYEIKAQM